MTHSFQVLKASGDLEPFNEEKLSKSLRRSGADEVLIHEIIQELSEQWHEGISTRAIFKKAYKMLKRRNRPYASRYTLKQAMFDFGPSGFPFEDFIAEVMKSQGFTVETRARLAGACVQHEVDVVAQKKDRLIWIECKYHPIPGSVSNVKVPLYVHSRFRDLEQFQNGNRDLRGEGWIVTNTRFSDDAMSYGRCVGIRLVGWNYPNNGSLREMVDRANLHPVTCLTYLTRQEKNKLLENGIVLSSTLSRPGSWSDLLHLTPERRNKIIEEATTLCETPYSMNA